MENPVAIELEPSSQTTKTSSEQPPVSSEAPPKSKHKRQGPFSYLHFLPIFKLTRKINKLTKQKKPLLSTDLPDLPWDDRPDILEEKITRCLQSSNNGKPVKGKSVTWAVLKTVKYTLLIWILIHTVFIFLRVFTAWVLKKLIETYVDPSMPISEAYKWSGALSAVIILSFYTEHHYDYLSYLLPTHVKNCLISLIYSKVTRLSAFSLNQISLGKLVNLVVSDMSVFELTANFATNVITAIFGICGSTVLLWLFFGPSCLVGIGYIVLSAPLQQLFIKLTGKPKKDKAQVTDQRIKTTSELIEGIRLLKMYAWELRFRDMVETIRKKELGYMTRILFWESIERGLTFGAHAIALFLMLLTYVFTGHELDLTTVFPAYYLLGILRQYGSFYATLALNFIFDAQIVMSRVQSVMDFPETEHIEIEEPHDPSNVVEFDNFHGYWMTDKAEDEHKKAGRADGDQTNLVNSESKPTLIDISVNIKKGSLNAVIGTVGSAKSSFLMSFTGEMPKTTGSFRRKGTIAYAEQEPTIFAGTFRENVLFGKPFDQEFYDKVVKACNLENDLVLLGNGDLSEIGERGNNLSGGQRARLGLARAVYADADIYLLDDPLSAVDAKVAKSLVNDVIMTMLKDKTVILVTHQVHFVKDFENIIVLEGGHVLGKGNYAELKEMNIDVDGIFQSSGDKEEKNPLEKPKEIPVSQNGEVVSTQQIQLQEKHETQEPKHNAEQENYFTSEDPYAGKVDRHTYKGFMKDMGGIPIMLFLLVVWILTEFNNVAFMRILGGWAIGEFDQTTGLAVLGGLSLSLNFIYVFRSVLIALLLLKVSRKLQTKVLNAVVRAPVQFFDTNPLGRILSRFSNDVGVLDTYLPLVTMNMLDIFSDLFCLLFALSIINPILIGPLAGIVIGSVLMMKFSYQSVKQTKDCDLETRDPVNNLFSASLSGMTIIRVYKQENTFKQKFRNLLLNNTKASVAFCNTSSFFGFYVDIMFSIGGVVCIFIITACKMDPPIAALCIITVLNFAGLLSFGLRQLIQVNVLMASVGRMQAYEKIPTEASLILSQDEEYKKQGWPQKGVVDFHKVYMKYCPETDYILKDLTLHAYPGEKIGCIGRTGAGKSSIIQVLFRLIEIDRNGADKADSYIKLDEVDIQTLGLHLLRNNISIIPQVPFIFSGTVKKNIDPTDKFSDDEIWRVLEDVNLKTHVEKLDGQLYFEIGDISSVFSVGQKQLICLARTILNPSNLLVLDEATANMDQQTDMFIQDKIREKFSNSTVFTIAHRLSTIANYDKVLVLDKGRKVEFEAPYRLLVKKIGDDYITNEDGHFGSMVLNTGPKASKHIFDMAKTTYFKKFEKDVQMKEEERQL